MAPILYTMDVGFPTRAVKLVIRNLNLNVEYRPVDMLNGEHLSPELLQINPAHTIPFLKDGDFIINESEAIAKYLIESRASESPLLGRFPKKKAKINQMLCFAATNLAPKFKALYTPILSQGATIISEESKRALLETFALLDLYICKGYWAAGENLSIADFFLLSIVESAVQLGLKLESFPNVQSWYKCCNSLTGFEENQQGAKQMAEWIKSKLTEEIIWTC